MDEQFTILAVDDNPQILELIETVLAPEGYQVLVADTGEMALVIMGLRPPDLILLDIVMTGMDGIEVCRRLKSREETRCIPVILISGVTDVEEWVNGLRAGAADFIAKPFGAVELLARVKTQQQIIVSQELLNQQETELRQMNEQLRAREETQAHLLAELSASEARYRRITEGLTDYQYTVRVENGRAVETRHSLTCLMATGYSAEEFAADPNLWITMVPPEDREEVTGRLQKFLAGEEVEPLVHRLIRKDGAVRWVSDKFIPLRAPSGALIAYDGVIKDITERKQAEEALMQSEERYRTLADFTYDWEYWLGPDGRFIYCAAACERITGYRAEQFIHDPDLLVAIVHPDDRQLALSHLHELHDACTDAAELAFRILTRTGEVRWIWHSCLPVYDRQGHYQGRRGCNRDITGRKQAEEEAIKLHAQLSQAQKMEAIGILAGGIAHDFNNILSIILGYVDMARDDVPPGSPLASNLERVLTAAKRARDLVKQILAFSRQTNIERMPLSMVPLVKESVKMLRASIPTTITILESIQPQCGVILADPTQIHQVVMNLCTNAYHAMEQSCGVLSVGLKPTVFGSPTVVSSGEIAAGEYVELTVSDTGCGIGPEIIGMIFDPYFTTKELGKGTGMGLAITLGIITSYDGGIMVASTLGQGTTFHLYFPVIPAEVEEAAQARVMLRGDERILFVDDEETMVEMGRDMLEQLGYRVTGHTRSIKALAAFMHASDQFDLVITDQTMPGLTGAELAKNMLLMRPDIPIILCTGYSASISKEKAMALGIKAFTLKPLVKSEFAHLIRQVLDPPADSEAPLLVGGDLPKTGLPAGDTPAPGRTVHLAPSDWAALPDQWINKFRQAVIACHYNQTTALIREILAEQPELAGSLMALADSFSFDTLMALTEERDNANANG